MILKHIIDPGVARNAELKAVSVSANLFVLQKSKDEQDV